MIYSGLWFCAMVQKDKKFMVFSVGRFEEQDKQAFYNLWNAHDPWGKENNRHDIADSNWSDIISGQGPLHAFALRNVTKNPVGFILYRYNVSSKTSQHECYICDIFVDECFRKQNGAIQMLNAVTEEAKKNNSSRVCWMSNPENLESAALYRKFPAEKHNWSYYIMWLE